jgi:hypothetical protein
LKKAVSKSRVLEAEVIDMEAIQTANAPNFETVWA